MKITKEAKILEDEEVQLFSSLIMAALPDGMAELLLSSQLNPEDSIRMRSLGIAFRTARESVNESLKDTSIKTKIPQYRIREIEGGNASQVKPDFLRKLNSYYELDKWCSRWASKNMELAERLGMLEWVNTNRNSGRQRQSILPETYLQKVEKLIEVFVESRRPPQHLRPELDIGYRIIGQSFEIFEIRPRWQQPEVTQEISVAKATYVKSTKIWRLYWMRADLKWHRYDPLPDTKSLQDVLNEIGEDPFCCFWG